MVVTVLVTPRLNLQNYNASLESSGSFCFQNKEITPGSLSSPLTANSNNKIIFTTLLQYQALHSNKFYLQ